MVSSVVNLFSRVDKAPNTAGGNRRGWSRKLFWQGLKPTCSLFSSSRGLKLTHDNLDLCTMTDRARGWIHR